VPTAVLAPPVPNAAAIEPMPATLEPLTTKNRDGNDSGRMGTTPKGPAFICYFVTTQTKSV